MPGQGYSTVGLKPAVQARLQNITDTYYPGMFLPSTLIIMMNEVKRGYYSIEPHNVRVDLSGRYNSITIRSDVHEWLEKNYEELGKEYEQRYKVECFSKFISYFMINLFESKLDTQNHVIRLKESDFAWLQDEYRKRKNSTAKKYEVPTFDRFADLYINELLEKVKTAREILTL
jgi:hypothetical protein